jgi:hypothetical protein
LEYLAKGALIAIMRGGHFQNPELAISHPCTCIRLEELLSEQDLTGGSRDNKLGKILMCISQSRYQKRYPLLQDALHDLLRWPEEVEKTNDDNLS